MTHVPEKLKFLFLGDSSPSTGLDTRVRTPGKLTMLTKLEAFHCLKYFYWDSFYINGKLYICSTHLLSSSSSSSSSLSECSAQGQNYKRRNQGFSSAEGRSSTANSGTKAAILPKGRSSTANSGTKVTVLPKGRSSTANSGTRVAVLPKAGLPPQPQGPSFTRTE